MGLGGSHIDVTMSAPAAGMAYSLRDSLPLAQYWMHHEHVYVSVFWC